jgi:hypothetical protein
VTFGTGYVASLPDQFSSSQRLKGSRNINEKLFTAAVAKKPRTDRKECTVSQWVSADLLSVL